MKKKDVLDLVNAAGAAGKISFDYSSRVQGSFVIEQFWIVFSNGKRLLFEKSGDRRKFYDALIRHGYERDLNLSCDEMDGLSQVGRNGITWDEPTILSR